MLCKWCTDKKQIATPTNWEWLKNQHPHKPEDFPAFNKIFDNICWEHEICEYCNGKGEGFYLGDDGLTEDWETCPDCQGDGSHHRDCGMPSSYCECDVDEW